MDELTLEVLIENIQNADAKVRAAARDGAGPVGCKACDRGYKGRSGIFQVMPVTDGISRVILEGGNAVQIEKAAAEDGIWDLRRSGLEKVKEGVTSLEEVNRVTIS